jgi:hypothetical protein
MQEKSFGLAKELIEKGLSPAWPLPQAAGWSLQEVPGETSQCLQPNTRVAVNTLNRDQKSRSNWNICHLELTPCVRQFPSL